MKEPTALAPSEKKFQVVAPVGYGSEGPCRLPSAFFGYFAFSSQRDCTALPLSQCFLQKNVRDAFSEHDTIRQTTWNNSSSPGAVFCRNRPPKTSAETILKPCVPLSYWQNLRHGSSAVAFSIPLLPPFFCVMDAHTEASVEGVVFADRRAGEVLVVEFTRLLANRGLTRKIGNFWPNWTSSSLSLCVRTDPAAPCTPCFRMCWSVKRPSFHRHMEK